MAQIQERRSRAGVVSYRARLRLRGHPEASATFSRKTDARRWVQDTESAIREGRYFALAEAKRHTLGDLVDRYIDEVLRHNPKNAANPKRNLLWWKAQIGAYALADVGAPLIVQQKNRLLGTMTRRGGQMSPSTVVR